MLIDIISAEWPRCPSAWLKSLNPINQSIYLCEHENEIESKELNEYENEIECVDLCEHENEIESKELNEYENEI